MLFNALCFVVVHQSLCAVLDGAFYAAFKGHLVLDDIVSEVESINAHLSSRDYSSVSGLSQRSPFRGASQ